MAVAKRYEQLFPLIDQFRPGVIVEVGVHRAMRAMMMSERALRWRKAVRYIGYDVFETMPADFHAAALNGKGIPLQAVAEARLQSVAERFTGFAWEFRIGDTRNTLHGQEVHADFAFIDGDHRVDAVRGDAAALRCPVIVFDDYYVAGADGRIPDLLQFGANAAVEEARAAGCVVTILPAGDVCAHGGVAHLAVVEAR